MEPDPVSAHEDWVNDCQGREEPWLTKVGALMRAGGPSFGPFFFWGGGAQGLVHDCQAREEPWLTKVGAFTRLHMS